MVVERKVGQKKKEINLLGALREADHINLIGPARRQSVTNWHFSRSFHFYS